MQRDYEVMRLIRQDANYHVIMDYVSGEALGEYVIRHPCIEKEQFFSWIFQLLEQLEGMERVKKGPSHITPFYIILKTDQTVAVLNLYAKVNQKFLDKVSTYSYIHRFHPEGEMRKDIYSFGKTMQFLLAKSNLAPGLTRREESILKKIISKCLTENFKKQYQNFSDITSDFSTIEKKNRKIKNKIIGLSVFLISLSLGIGIGGWLKNELQQAMILEEEETYWDAGISYFLVLEDYQKSREMFGNLENLQKAKVFQAMASYMYGESEYTNEEMGRILQNFIREQDEELSLQEKYCLIRVYSRIDTVYARKQILEMGEEVLANCDWQEGEEEVREILANVYLKQGRCEEALQEYEMLFGQSHREALCKIMVDLYEKCGMPEDALRVCADGMVYNKESKELAICYVRLICESEIILSEEKAVMLEAVLRDYPNLQSEQRFQMLQKQYGIEVEGEQIWLEK